MQVTGNAEDKRNMLNNSVAKSRMQEILQENFLFSSTNKQHGSGKERDERNS